MVPCITIKGPSESAASFSLCLRRRLRPVDSLNPYTKQQICHLNQTSRKTNSKLWEGSAAFHLCHFFPSDRHAARISETCCDPSVHNAHALIPAGRMCPGLSPSWVPQPAGNSYSKETPHDSPKENYVQVRRANKYNLNRTYILFRYFHGYVWDTSFERLARVQTLSNTSKKTKCRHFNSDWPMLGLDPARFAFRGPFANFCSFLA